MLLKNSTLIIIIDFRINGNGIHNDIIINFKINKKTNFFFFKTTFFCFKKKKKPTS